ncbi:MAG: NAD(P)/FAD-dependent oxidoreductase [Mycobacterium sp.]
MVSALVVGSGPNGLAAAITLAHSGVEVVIAEADDVIGGGLRSAELTMPGLMHDHCAAIVPTAVSSPFMRSLNLESHGVTWAWAPIELVHPLDAGRAGVLHRSMTETMAGLGSDGQRWGTVFRTLARDYDLLADDILGPMVKMPQRPLRLARFGAAAMLPATALARMFTTDEGRGLFAGNAAHGWTPLTRPPSGAIGLVFGAVAHRYGWPCVVGGTGQLAAALQGILHASGGRIETGVAIKTRAQVSGYDMVVFTTGPGLVLQLFGADMPARFRRAYRRHRYGPAAFKIDLAVHQGIPWTNEMAGRAGTVHVCGGIDEVVAAERATGAGRMPERPFVLVAQQAVADPTRSCGDLQPVYMYAHVPHGYGGDPTEAMLAQVERFAPGFRERIAMLVKRGPADLERENANNVGGDINGGAMDLRPFLARPRFVPDPYWTGIPGVFLGSSSTPPGPGLHGMCGHLAAQAALRQAGLSGGSSRPPRRPR